MPARLSAAPGLSRGVAERASTSTRWLALQRTRPSSSTRTTARAPRTLSPRCRCSNTTKWPSPFSCSCVSRSSALPASVGIASSRYAAAMASAGAVDGSVSTPLDSHDPEPISAGCCGLALAPVARTETTRRGANRMLPSRCARPGPAPKSRYFEGLWTDGNHSGRYTGPRPHTSHTAARRCDLGAGDGSGILLGARSCGSFIGLYSRF